MEDDTQPQQQYDPTQYRDIMRHRALADALMAKMGDTSPTRSKWEGLSRAILPLLGALLKNRTDSQYGELSDSANPEFAQMAQSDNPMAIAAASKNPLIRAMLPQMAQMQMQAAMNARGKGLETSAVGQAKLGFEPQLAGQTARAQVAPHVAEAVQTEQGTMPMKEKLMRLQAALGLSNEMAKPVQVAPGNVLTNPATGLPVGSANTAGGGQTPGPWSSY